MDAEVVNIFSLTLKKIKKDLEHGPLPVDYLVVKHGIEVFLRLLEIADDLEVTGADSDKYVSLKKKEE